MALFSACGGRKLNNKFKSESLAPKDFNVIFINYSRRVDMPKKQNRSQIMLRPLPTHEIINQNARSLLWILDVSQSQSFLPCKMKINVDGRAVDEKTIMM